MTGSRGPTLADKENLGPPGAATCKSHLTFQRQPVAASSRGSRPALARVDNTPQRAGMEPAGGNTASKPGTAAKTTGRETPTVQLRQASWDRQLDAYARPSGSSPTMQRTLRARLAEGVKAAHESPEAWWTLLQHEEGWAAAAGNTSNLERGGAVRGSVTLFDLYAAATKVVPRQNNYNNESFIRIWLGYARQQWARNPDDARDVFKMLKSQHIGDQHAALYYEWAALEAGAGGNAFKALGVLAKGLKEQAQPACLLEQTQSDLQAGRFVYKAPWAQDGGGKTGYSGASSLGAAFLTPGVLDDRRSAATPTLDVTGVTSAAATTDTLVLNRGAVRLGSNLAPRPTDSGKIAAGGSSDTGTLLGGAAATSRPAAGNAPLPVPTASQQQQGLGQHHTTGLTEHLHANRTSHTIHSGSTVGSDDPTATMRMKTPATALSNRTSSSTGSLGEEATVSIRKLSGSGSRRSGEGTSIDHHQRGSGDDTLVINRASLLKTAVASSASAPKEGAQAGGSKDAAQQGLLKPRRLGVLGKAQRVVAGAAARPPLAPASGAPAPAEQQQALDGATASAAPAAAPGIADQLATEEASDANRKRKAEVDALQSPKPLLSVGEGKRRQSPSPEEQAKRSGLQGAELPPLPRPAERQLPPVPRFDEQPAATGPSARIAGTTSRTAAASETLSAAAPSRPPLPASAHHANRAPPAATAGSQLPLPAAGQSSRQQLVLKEGAAAAGDRSKRHEQEGGDEDETAPVVMSKLAQRVQRGRQSLAPSKIILGGDGSLLQPSGASAAGTPGLGDEDDAPTMPVSRPPALAAPPAAAADEDADATRPLARPPGPTSASVRAASPPQSRPEGPRVQIDGAGNVNVMRPSSAGVKPLPVPPPPPPVAESGRVPMGPPPPKLNRTVATGAAPTAAQQPAARPGRRVVEDENTVTVKDIVYTKLECVGRGGSSKVYKVMAPNRKIFALKRIRLQGRDAEAASGFLDEIRLLNSLAGRTNIIQLIDSEVHRSEGLIYMVLEFGDIDLARLLQKHEKTRRERESGGGQVEDIDENFIRLYWEQMLQAVDTIHRERIVHSDLKPANFLVVEGQLKLIDFGIAKAIQSDTTSIARESQVGTLNYMSPEAILGGQNNIRGGPPMKVGRASDIWSLGCILYQMVYGQTPFSHLPFIQKMHAIIDANHRISFPALRNSALLDVIQRCLDRNPRSRISMQELLEHPFLRPTQAPAPAPTSKPGSVELSREQLTKLLRQVAAAGVSGAEVGQLSEQLFKQLASGLSPDLVSRKALAAAEGRAATGGAGVAIASVAGSAASVAAPQQGKPAPQQSASVADVAAAAAAARSGQRADALAALESRPRPGAPAAGASGSGRAALMPISQAAIAQQAAALRKVEPSARQPAARQPESGLEAALRKGLERFKFEDATAGEEGGNTTGGFGDL